MHFNDVEYIYIFFFLAFYESPFNLALTLAGLTGLSAGADHPGPPRGFHPLATGVFCGPKRRKCAPESVLTFRAAGVFRVGVARRCAKVVSMVTDVGVISMAMGREEEDGGGVLRWPRSRDQGQGESDCSHPDRKSKTSTPRGEAREKGAISRAKLLRGWRREKYHSNNSIRRDQREGGMEGWRDRGREGGSFGVGG